MSDDNLRRRVNRIEEELGIDPGGARFEEICRGFRLMGVELESVNQDKQVATYNITGEDTIGTRRLDEFDRVFHEYEVDIGHGAVRVYGLDEGVEQP
jgi:hypothetical protein